MKTEGFAEIYPAWARRLDRLFHRRNTLDALMQALTDAREAAPTPIGMAGGLIRVFVRTPWPHLQVAEMAIAGLADMPQGLRERALLRWKRAFYALVLRDHASRSGAESPHPFHEAMLRVGNAEYIQLLRQWEIDQRLEALSTIRQDRLRKAGRHGGKVEEVFLLNHTFNRAMLKIDRIESGHILRAIRDYRPIQQMDTGG